MFDVGECAVQVKLEVQMSSGGSCERTVREIVVTAAAPLPQVLRISCSGGNGRY